MDRKRAVIMIQIGGHYQVFGTHVVVVAWDADDGSVWLLLHAAASDVPIYRRCPTGDLEPCRSTADTDYRGRPCDGTIADMVPSHGDRDVVTQ